MFGTTEVELGLGRCSEQQELGALAPAADQPSLQRRRWRLAAAERSLPAVQRRRGGRGAAVVGSRGTAAAVLADVPGATSEEL